MSKNLKKSLFLSVAALGFLAAAGTVNAQNASAKSYARVTSNAKMTTLPQNRNVTFTGHNALYTKAGTLRGARKVASITTLNNLANSKSSQNNARAYRVATTNRGSVYFKIVTYDGQYRGWIYGGKSIGDFGGGVDQYTTFKTQDLSTLTSAQQNATYKIANPGTANDGKTVTYKQPAWTQYKVGRAITDSTPYANTTFKIDQVGTRAREGDQWVHIYDVNNANSPAAGWILMSGLTQAQAPIADNAIQINLVDPTNNSNVVKSITITRNGATKGTNFGYQSNGSWTISNSDRSSILNQIRGALSGTSYGLDYLSTAQLAQIAQTQFGSSVNIVLNKATNIADNAVRINFVKADGSILKSVDWNKTGATKGTNVGFLASGNSLWSLNSSDQSGIQSALVTALNGTGYQLDTSSNTLNSTQIDQIARGTFGGQVYISVSAVPTVNYSVITPYAYTTGGNSTNATALNPTSGTDTTTSVTLKAADGSNVANVTAPASSITAQQVTDVVNSYSAGDARTKALKDINAQLYTAAASQYQLKNLNFNGFTGTSGVGFSSLDVMNYLANDTNGKTLKTLQSPNFNQFSNVNGTIIRSAATPITFTAQTANSGTFGKPVNVYYSYKAFGTN